MAWPCMPKRGEKKKEKKRKRESMEAWLYHQTLLHRETLQKEERGNCGNWCLPYSKACLLIQRSFFSVEDGGERGDMIFFFFFPRGGLEGQKGRGEKGERMWCGRGWPLDALFPN